MPQIVLISGHAGSGKDTFADFLIKYLPDARKYAFADSIKEIARKYFDWNGVKDRKGRQLLIGIGAAGREENLHVWTERVIEKIEKDRPGIAVISDWRFKHEYEKMKEVFGMENIMTVRIQKEGIKVIDDISEHDLDDFLDFDFIIQNNGSLQELEKQAEITAGHIQGVLSKREIVELNGSIKIKMWLQDKTPHNEIGPAYVEYYPAEGVQRKIWLQKGKVYREDGPAIIRYRENGTVEEETWFYNDNYHRTDGPAIISYYENGNIRAEKWFLNGKLHREDGPAVENYSRDGTIIKKEYFLNGNAVTKEVLANYKKINSLLKEAQKEKKIRL